MTVKKIKREPMKTLSQQLKRISGKISRALADYREAFRGWLDAAASKLFPTPAPVRVVNPRQNQSQIPRRQ